MDNKKAIECLKSIDILKYRDDDENYFFEDVKGALDIAIKSLEKLDRITSEVNWLCSVKKTEFNYKIAFDSIKKIIWDWIG